MSLKAPTHFPFIPIKTWIIGSAILLFATTGFSQDVVSIDYLLSTPSKQVDIYRLDRKDSTLLVIPFDFSSNESDFEQLMDSLQQSDRTIEKIDFVYTRFKVSETFDQEKLNRSRLELLRLHAPLIFDNNLIEWNFYEQVNDFNLESNKRLFHGFVIHFLKHPTYAGNKGLSTEEEIKIIKDYLKTVVRKSESSSFHVIERSPQFYPILKKKKEKGILYDKKFLRIWRKQSPVLYDTIWTPVIEEGFYKPFPTDTVVIQTLRRYEDKWNCNFLIEDVTGSMYPYIAQTLAWKKLKMDSSILEHFVFFNDGDNHPDGPIGKSGGAYYFHSDDFEKIADEIYRVMQKGSGGGAPENNIEATLYGESKFKESDSYILIADNNAPIRDMAISNKIQKPTHMILCGVRNGRIHHSYINLAIKTGGTLHTIEEDINKIATLSPGDIFEMGGQKWKYLGPDQIVLIRE